MALSLRSAGITPASSLLRSSPPLPGASVLSASRLEPLAPFPLASPDQVLTFRTRAWLSFAPPTCRMPLGPSQDISQADPGGRVTPPVLTSPNPLSTLHRRFACARLSQPCLPGSSSRRFRNAHHRGFWTQQLAVAWDQRPDRRTRRDLLHLSYSCAPPFGPAILVTQDPQRSSGPGEAGLFLTVIIKMADLNAISVSVVE